MSNIEFNEEYDFGFTAIDSQDLEPQNDYRDRLYKMYGMIEPFIKNLMQNPEKEVIKWPNRKEKLENFLVQLNDLLDK